MPTWKNVKARKAYIRTHYKENPDYYKNRNKLARQRNHKWYWKLKKTLKCKKCGNNDFRVIEFHHRNPKKKFKNIYAMVHRCHSIKNILKEIKKCDPLCANCHRIVTWKSRGKSNPHLLP